MWHMCEDVYVCVCTFMYVKMRNLWVYVLDIARCPCNISSWNKKVGKDEKGDEKKICSYLCRPQSVLRGIWGRWCGLIQRNQDSPPPPQRINHLYLEIGKRNFDNLVRSVQSKYFVIRHVRLKGRI